LIEGGQGITIKILISLVLGEHDDNIDYDCDYGSMIMIGREWV
jgi:hypothetical protein